MRFRRSSWSCCFNGLSAVLGGPLEVAISRDSQSLVISSDDGSWHEVLDYRVADYLDDHDPLIGQQFEMTALAGRRRANTVPCPTVLTVEFQLVLSRQQKYRTFAPPSTTSTGFAFVFAIVDSAQETSITSDRKLIRYMRGCAVP